MLGLLAGIALGYALVMRLISRERVRRSELEVARFDVYGENSEVSEPGSQSALR